MGAVNMVLYHVVLAHSSSVALFVVVMEGMVAVYAPQGAVWVMSQWVHQAGAYFPIPLVILRHLCIY